MDKGEKGGKGGATAPYRAHTALNMQQDYEQNKQIPGQPW